MSVAQQVVEHDVLFAESDAELVNVAGERLAGAIAGGAAAIVIATEEHRRAFGERIRATGADAAAGNGTLIALDASEILDQITPGGSFDRDAFDKVVGDAVRTARAHRPVYAFGEMVALLWDDDRPQEAIDLEAAWDHLIRETSSSLLCAYPGRLVDDAEHASEFSTICGLHSGVVTDAPFERSWSFEDGRGTASDARRVVANALRARGASEDMFYDTLTVVTELVANALQHGGSPFSVGLTLEPARAVVRVRDDNPDEPVVRRQGHARFPTRGLQLVDAIAGRWGVEPADGGKVVWAEVAR